MDHQFLGYSESERGVRRRQSQRHAREAPASERSPHADADALDQRACFRSGHLSHMSRWWAHDWPIQGTFPVAATPLTYMVVVHSAFVTPVRRKVFAGVVGATVTMVLSLLAAVTVP